MVEIHDKRVGDIAVIHAVPAAESLRLATELRQRGWCSQLTLLTEPDVKHRITPQALDATAAFFLRTL